MRLQRVLQYAQHLIEDTVEQGDYVIDATAGNGHDTLFLANLVGDNGHVYAFDIQKQAVDATQSRLAENHLQHRATIINDGHENISKYVTQSISSAIFNLGYLPGSDHEVITKPNTTIQALESILQLLKIGGIIVLVIYHGHEGGKLEKEEVLQYVSGLPQKYFHVLKYQFLNQKNDPPFVVAIEKVK